MGNNYGKKIKHSRRLMFSIISFCLHIVLFISAVVTFLLKFDNLGTALFLISFLALFIAIILIFSYIIEKLKEKHKGKKVKEYKQSQNHIVPNDTNLINYNSKLYSHNVNNHIDKASKSIQSSTLSEIILPERQEKQPPFLFACREALCSNDYIAYFKNGSLYDVNPRNTKISLDEDRGTAYKARYIVSDGIKYDLEDPSSIRSMVIPKFKQTGNFPQLTRDLAYIIKMRVGGEFRPKLAVPLTYKAANLMIHSGICYQKKDYYRLVIQLWQIGEIKYGDYLLEELKKIVPNVAADDEITEINKEVFNQQIYLAKELQMDYMLLTDNKWCYCGVCAPYVNRIYCISGNDKRFPKLPDFILKQKGLHCPISYHVTFYYKGFEMTIYEYNRAGNMIEKTVDPIKYSNRPFKDDRNEAEKNHYEMLKSKQKSRQEHDSEYYNRSNWIDKYNDCLEYQKIVDILGEKAPKNYSAYRRMKKQNSANFIKIKEMVANIESIQ